MKAEEIRELSITDIEEKIEDMQDAQEKLLLAHNVSQLENPMVLKENRKTIARLFTELKAREEGRETSVATAESKAVEQKAETKAVDSKDTTEAVEEAVVEETQGEAFVDVSDESASGGKADETKEEPTAETEEPTDVSTESASSGEAEAKAKEEAK